MLRQCGQDERQPRSSSAVRAPRGRRRERSVPCLDPPRPSCFRVHGAWALWTLPRPHRKRPSGADRSVLRRGLRQEFVEHLALDRSHRARCDCLRTAALDFCLARAPGSDRPTAENDAKVWCENCSPRWPAQVLPAASGTPGKRCGHPKWLGRPAFGSRTLDSEHEPRIQRAGSVHPLPDSVDAGKHPAP
jgi:hypothetical protein